MVSLYVKGKENGHVQAYAPTGAMVLKWRGSLTSKLDDYPVTSEPHLWRQACPWRKSLSRKIALTRIKFYGRKLQVKAFGQMKDVLILCAFGAILCPGNFRHGQALPLGNEAQPAGIAVELARKAIPLLQLSKTFDKQQSSRNFSALNKVVSSSAMVSIITNSSLLKGRITLRRISEEIAIKSQLPNKKCRKSQRLTGKICRKSQRGKSWICRKSQHMLINLISAPQ